MCERITSCQARVCTPQVWKLPSLVAVLTLRGHKRGVWHAAFSPVDQVRRRCRALAWPQDL
jgi:hypothetical protein